ncbi:MAG: hypothetical protein R3E79_37515 [Caldilineaceae bacterium]
MNYESYRTSYFVDPAPQPRFAYAGIHGATLFFSDYRAAVAYYEQVLGPPAYVEGDGTRGWRLGNTWLTLLKGGNGLPTNVEIPLVLQSPQDAEALAGAFIVAGGQGEPPTDQLMYEPVRFCPVRDPFGTQWLIFSPLGG